MAGVLVCLAPHARARTGTTQLQHREHRQVIALRRHVGTLNFFRHHRWLVRREPTRPVALRALRVAHVWIPILRRELRETRASLHPRPVAVPDVICAVFGDACSKALSVASCESHYSVYATNGQYHGIFQMGERERARFGGSTFDVWEQVRAAYAYYRIAGWSPWQCA